jgi:asparagine synthase (glutamine-hydrolysing)
MPLLAQPVVEACLRVPSWMWIDGGRNRAIARDAFSEALPETILNRRSKGTFMNYTASVYRRSRQTIASFLLDGSLQAQGLLDRAALERYLAQPPVARDDTFMRLFDLCMIENWVRHHR